MLFVELVCTIRKQKQKKITFIVKKPNVFEIQCLKVLKSKLSSVRENRYFREAQFFYMGRICVEWKRKLERTEPRKEQSRRTITQFN